MRFFGRFAPSEWQVRGLSQRSQVQGSNHNVLLPTLTMTMTSIKRILN